MKKTMWALVGAMIVLSIIFASCAAGTPNGELEAEGVVAGASENETVSESVTEPTSESTTELTTESTTVTTTKPTTEATTKETTTAKPTTTHKQTTTKKETTTQKPTTTKQETTTKKETTTQKQTTTQTTTTVKYAGKEDEKVIANKIVEYINSYRSAPATKLPGLTEYCEYRSRQLVTNFAHDTADQRAAANALQYGEYYSKEFLEYVGANDTTPYYDVNAREACAKAGYKGSADYVAEQLALQFKNSADHWAYLGNAEYLYIAVGVTYQDGMWYCCVCVSRNNIDELQ